MIKKNDNVTVVSGKDHGKRGKVLTVLHENDRVVVDGVAMMKRHEKARKSGQKGQIVSRPMSVHASNVMVVCPKCDRGVRVGAKMVGDKKMRACKRCGTEL